MLSVGSLLDGYKKIDSAGNVSHTCFKFTLKNELYLGRGDPVTSGDTVITR